MWLLVISPSSILCFYHGKLPELDSFWFVIYFKDINFGGYFLKKAFIWKKTELRLESCFVKFERKEIFYWKRWKKMPCCFKIVWMMHKDIFIRVNLVFIQIWRIIWPQNSIAKKSNVTFHFVLEYILTHIWNWLSTNLIEKIKFKFILWFIAMIAEKSFVGSRFEPEPLNR